MVRKSPKGLDVPKGYSPLEYDEYKSKIDPIVKQIEAIKKKYTYKPSGWMNSGGNGSDKMSDEDTKLLNQLRLERDKINGEYYNIDYPDGITKEELDSYKKWKKSIDDYYTYQESKYCRYGNVFDDPSYYNQSKTTQEKLRIDQYENQFKCTNLKNEHKVLESMLKSMSNHAANSGGLVNRSALANACSGKHRQIVSVDDAITEGLKRGLIVKVGELYGPAIRN